MGEALRIPAAKKAVDGEWDMRGNKQKVWDVLTVKERCDIITRCERERRTCHFGTLMDLCHVKHSKLPPGDRSCKGTVVRRGNAVRDETGYLSIFSEQGTSASHLAAAKFLDAIARFPDNDGSDSDALGAYTRLPLKDLEEEQGIETWISSSP